ncbi:MAG: addiction module toxin RelE [Rhizobiales bacterium]|nr:addiction module toxin RelE [Hyphomicrobiales bacterium]
MHAVIETPGFQRDASGAGLSDDDVAAIVATISRDPKCGDVMEGTGGARKIRFAGRGKGKRGGYRVVTYFGGDDIPVFLLALFSKGDLDNLSKAARNELRNELAGIATDYRAFVRTRVTRLKRRTAR